MTVYHFRIYLYLAGEMKYQLCTVETPEMAAEVVKMLCRVDRPDFTRVEIELMQPETRGL